MPRSGYVVYVPKAGDKAAQRADKQQAAQRRHQRSAVAALHAFTNLDAGARDEHRFPEPNGAMRELATAIDEGTLRVPRLLVLDSLVKFASRRSGDLGAHEPALDAVIGSLVQRAGVPSEGRMEAIATVRGALDSAVQGRSGTPVRHPWRAFTREAAGALRLTKAEIEKPLCNDSEVVTKGSHKAIGVTVEFLTDDSPDDLRHFCDPTRWHECSAYQRGMRPWDAPGAVDEQRPNGWRRDLWETVEFSTAKTLETPLRFTYAVQDETNPRWIYLDYVLLAETEDIVVDEGAIRVHEIAAGRNRGRTQVSAKKAILFSDPVLRTWPTVACDTFWTDLVIAAAVGCSDDGGKPPITGRKNDG